MSGILACAFAAFITNYALVTMPANAVLRSDRAYDDISFQVSYLKFIDPNNLAVDLKSVAGTTSMADVDRQLLLIAERFRDRRFDSVFLKYQGKTRFYLSGAAFQMIGSEYHSGEHLVGVLMKLPSELYTPRGDLAFGNWTGGWLGVMQKQLEDHNEFHHQWYIDAMQPSRADLGASAQQPTCAWHCRGSARQHK